MTNSIPAGWEIATLDDLASIVRGVTFPASAKLPAPSDDSVLCLRTSNVQKTLEFEDVLHIAESYVKRDEQWLQDGDTVISMANSYELVGKVAYAKSPPPRTTIGGFISLIRPRRIDSRFLYYQLASTHVQEWMRETASTTVNISNLSLRGIRPLPLVVASLPEQQRIVEAIESYLTRLDAAVALLERVQQNLRRYRASVLKAAVEGRLVPTEAELARQEGRAYEPASELLKRILVERRKKWIENAAEKARAKAKEKARKAGKPWTHADDIKTLEKERAKAAKKYKEPAAPDTTDLANLPEGWCWATIQQVTLSMKNGLAKRRGTGKRSTHVLRLADIVNGNVDGKSPRDIPLEQEEWEKYSLFRRDILCIRVNGSRRLTGSFLQFSLSGNWAFCDHFIRLRMVPRLVNEAYSCRTFNVGATRDHISSGMVTTAGQNTVNQTVLGSAPMPLPPKSEQQRIASEIEQLVSIGENINCQLVVQAKRCQRLRQSILKWAFEGKLVPQDPNDEPASVLLERIKAERESMQPRNTRRRNEKRQRARQDNQLDLLGGSNK